jgi:energy-coupling factor transporter ATP-binding protein EcfA2
MRFVGGPAVRDLCLESISVSNGGAELISDCDVTLVWGRKYGLVGRNGAGKSTFLRALSGGEIKGVPSNCQILHVEQEISGGDETVLDCVLQCDAERIELLDELRRREEAGEDSAGLLEQLHAIDAFGAEAHAATILSGLQFTPEMQLQSTRYVSASGEEITPGGLDGWVDPVWIDGTAHQPSDRFGSPQNPPAHKSLTNRSQIAHKSLSQIAHKNAHKSLTTIAHKSFTAGPSPGVGGCAWRWRGPCSSSPTCCCWTSPPTTWTSTRCCGSRAS